MADLQLSYRRALARVRLVARTVTELGLRTMGLVAANSARRQVVAWRHSLGRRTVGVGQMPGRLLETVLDAAGARLVFERAELEVCFLATDVVRMSWGPGLLPVPYAMADEAPWPSPDVVTRPLAGGGLVLRTADLAVSVDGEGSVRMRRPDGIVLRTEAPPVRRGATWELRHGMRPGERFSGLGEQSAGVDLRGGRFALWNTDAGGSWTSGQGPLYLGIPVVVATHDDGNTLTFYENSTRGSFSFGDTGPTGPTGQGGESRMARGAAGTASVGFAGGVMRHYVIVGDVPHLLDRYTQLTGRPALPPRWALGYHQSRWGYKTEQDVRGIVGGYRTLGLPLSAVHLDIDYMDGYRVFTFDRSRFPDPAALASELSASGVRLVTIVDPGVKVDAGYDLYRQGLDDRRFCLDDTGRRAEGVVWPGRVAFPDFTDPGARAWWAEKYRVLTDAGIAGIWHDMNEPTSISLLGDPSLPLSTRHDFDGRGGDHGEGHNLYGLLMNRTGYEGLARARPEHRPFIVSRSGWAGMQRWAWNWTGDVASTWVSMRQQMATVIGLGLSGVPYSGPDIGGFSGVPHDELYTRWLQMSVLLPYCRTHSVLGAPAREPWRFEEPTRSIIVAWLRLRYRLLPYLYTLAHEASASGAPLVRPLWWPGPDGVAGQPVEPPPAAGPVAGDDAKADTDDAFLLGNSLLVAPVTVAGTIERAVALPAGDWRSLWAIDGGGAPGGTVARLEAPAGRIPVLVRAGSIVPLDDGWIGRGDHCRFDTDADLASDTGVGPDTDVADSEGPDHRGATAHTAILGLDHAPRRLALHCWPTDQGDAAGTCVDDAGDGYGPVRRDTLRMTGAVAGGAAVVTWGRDGDYPAPTVVRVVLHGFVAESATADGQAVVITRSSVECGAFSELRLEGLRSVQGLPT
jgi:alpha-glucosidase